MNKAIRQNKGINEIVSFDEFRINIESNLKFVYHSFITLLLEDLNSHVPDDITKQYFVREDLHTRKVLWKFKRWSHRSLAQQKL